MFALFLSLKYKRKFSNFRQTRVFHSGGYIVRSYAIFCTTLQNRIYCLNKLYDSFKAWSLLLTVTLLPYIQLQNHKSNCGKAIWLYLMQIQEFVQINKTTHFRIMSRTPCRRISEVPVYLKDLFCHQLYSCCLITIY